MVWYRKVLEGCLESVFNCVFWEDGIEKGVGSVVFIIRTFDYQLCSEHIVISNCHRMKSIRLKRKTGHPCVQPRPGQPFHQRTGRCQSCQSCHRCHRWRRRQPRHQSRHPSCRPHGGQPCRLRTLGKVLVNWCGEWKVVRFLPPVPTRLSG